MEEGAHLSIKPPFFLNKKCIGIVDGTFEDTKTLEQSGTLKVV